jgi:hypothetical protein
VKEIINSTKIIKQLEDILQNLPQGVALFNINSQEALVLSNSLSDGIFTSIYGSSELPLPEHIQKNIEKPALCEFTKKE